MLRSAFRLSAILIVSFAGAANAQSLNQGFAPSGSLPTVPLPSKVTVQTPVTPAPQTDVDSSKPSVALTRTGTEQTVVDKKAVPPDTGKAAANDKRTAKKGKTTASDASPKAEAQSTYFAGMTIYGKAEAFDGHSFVIDGNPLRLHGVDAPGLKQTCGTSSGTQWSCGARAFERLSALINGKNVKCVVTEPAGFGAAVICSASQTADIGKLLVREGLAIPNRSSAGIYKADATWAYRTHKGLWQGQFEEPLKWRNSHS